MDTCTKALDQYGSVRKAADALGIPRSTFFDRLNQERASITAIQHMTEPRIDTVRGKAVKRYIITCAVKGAPVHYSFLSNLLAYSEHLGAEFIVGGLTGVGRRRNRAIVTDDFHKSLHEYVNNQPIVMSDKIRYSPELNLTATMSKPLSGLRTYTKKHWAIFPHTKISAETVATHKDRPAKWIVTTGAVTHPRYSTSKAGFRAHFDHVHGALLVEVTKDGVWFRHLTPTNEVDGTFYDLMYKVTKGEVSLHKGVEAIIYGDIHSEKLDTACSLATWNYNPLGVKDRFNLSLVEALQPNTQVYHDIIDFTAGNHHELFDIFKRFGRWVEGNSKVHTDFTNVHNFIQHATSKSKHNVVVDSNHDAFIKKWLLNFNPRITEDFENITTYYALKLAVLKAIESKQDYSLLKLSLETSLGTSLPNNLRFLAADDSYEIKNIECGWHGHMGPNGSRGSKVAFASVAEKAIIGHSHSPGIESGLYVVGVSANLDMGYNYGPSSWAHTHCVVYPNGNRTLVTLSDGKFYADQE